MLSYKEVRKLSLHDPLIEGTNRSFLVTGYFPTARLKQILPKNMSVPSQSVFAEEYPSVKLLEGQTPFMMLLSRCYNVHDVITNIDLRPYLELLFYFPVLYSHGNQTRLCSYVPVLYLDFLIGTFGGMVLGLRKQFHPKLTYEETGTASTFNLEAIIRAKFEYSNTDNRQDLDPFFTQIFEKPTVTVSYINVTKFYTAAVHPANVQEVSAEYDWNYQGVRITNDEHTVAQYCEYEFTTSWAMRYKKYFGSK